MSARATTTSVADIMTRSPRTVTPGTSVRALMTLFEQHAVNAFPVVDEHGTLHGIVSKLDVLRLFHAGPTLRLPDPEDVAARAVADIMRPGVVNVEAGDPLVTAAELMVATRLRTLPVVRRGGATPELVGIVTQGDLLRALRSELQEAP
jgi:CBS domain-containing protein